MTVWACIGVVLAAANANAEIADFATFEASQLRCVVGNNKAWGDHRAGYNGIFQLVAPNDPESAFVPLYAGVNLEHYFDTRPRSSDDNVFFEPRRFPMALYRSSDHSVELHQDPTPVYGVESWTRFSVSEPYYINVEFRVVPRRTVFQGGVMGVFWASYINAPENKSMYFLGAGSHLKAPQWSQLCAQAHGLNSTVCFEGDVTNIQWPENSTLLYASMSPLRYSTPFFYGRVRNKVLIYMFQPNPYLRFAHSPSGGGKTPAGDDTNPAWDFQMVIPNYELNKEYKLNLCIVYKDWKGRDDVIQEVRNYMMKTGN
ncbi:MAG: hypothetical protein K1Y02_13835 [Candidatus Hydrogenedentes bacterium]|nr:hypothetical protein [Candidatus Hydrogenedentota bacterium]